MNGFEQNAALSARLRVEAFLADYVLALDADRLEDWPDFFTQDGSYRVVTRENFDQNLPLSLMSCHGRGMFRDRISALRTANIFEPHVYCHIPGALRLIDASDGAIEAESTFGVIRTMADGAMSIFACGRSRDRLVETSAGLKLAERIVILDSRQIDTLLVIPL
jgi:anthranilate 1,2-dioxygenase small subunit